MNPVFPQKQTKETKDVVGETLSSFSSFPSVESPVEREIDARVHRLYALTPEEIKLVEEAGK